MNKTILSTTLALALTTIGAASASAYTVKSGDTMGDIASNHNVGLNALIANNPQINNPHWIFPNDEIIIPNGSVNQPQVKEQAKAKVKEVVNVTNSEEMLLARLVEAEARNQSYQGKVAVAKTVLNRVANGQFPNDITSVIYQRNQFTPTTNGMIHNEPSNDSKRAVVEAVNQGGNPNGYLYFYNSSSATNRWLDSRPTVTVIGDHTFKR